MIKAKIKKNISIDEMLSYTNGGYDIYMHYLGKVGLMNRPWGGKEKLLSFSVFNKNNIWFWKDLAKEESGNALQFVERYLSLTTKQAIDKICWDFGMNCGEKVNANPIQITWDRPDKKYSKIIFSDRKFSDKDKRFWEEVDEDYCNSFNCWAVKDAVLNGSRISIRDNESVYAYYAEDIDSVKLYFPERVGQSRFISNVPYNYLWNINRIDRARKLIVAKSNKDMIVTSLLHKDIICTQAEAVKIFTSEVVDKINSISDEVWLWYGSDWDGVKKCKEITDTNHWKYINTPRELLPTINDPYLYMKSFKLEGLRKFMKEKKFYD